MNLFNVIKAAILGSILATMLLCLGLCFFAGGLRHEEQTFSDAISEAGSGLLLTAYVNPPPPPPVFFFSSLVKTLSLFATGFASSSFSLRLTHPTGALH